MRGVLRVLVLFGLVLLAGTLAVLGVYGCAVGVAIVEGLRRGSL